MKTIVLDASSLGADLDLTPLRRLPGSVIRSSTGKGELDSQIADADFIITNRVSLGEKELESCPDLKLIALTATGYNNVDIEYCRSRGIAVCNVRHYSTESVAQHCFAMLFYILEQTRYYDDYVRNRGYVRDRRFAELSRPWFEIKGKCWGIIGLGDIGRRVAEIASVFGARVVYASTSGVERNESWPRLDLDEVLKISDIISVHAPLSDKSRGLISRHEFSLMKESALFLNLGRGAVVDESALASALKEKRIRGAALDVLTEEPPSEENPLLDIIGERLLITPHNAWGSLESRNILVREVAENIEAFLRGEKRNRIV